MDFGFLKWRAHIKIGCSLKRLQLDEAAARVELGFTSLERAAQKATKMTSMKAHM